MSKKYCYLFTEGNAKMRELLGGKGANLAEMTNIGLPVPQGFTITTEACTQYYEDGRQINDEIMAEIMEYIEKMEKITGKKFGDHENPLLVSVRSGARASMPGMMDTILNLGLNEDVVDVIAKKSNNPRWAWDCYRRFIQMYSDVVMEVGKKYFEQLIDAMKEQKGVTQDVELDAADLKELAMQFKAEYKAKIGEDFPSDPKEQLVGAIKAVFRSWDNPRANVYRRDNDIPYSWGTAVNVQSMAFGNMGDDCGTGVAFTRDPATGAKQLMGEFLTNAQGEDVVAGVRTPMPIAEMAEKFPEAYDEFVKVCGILEDHYRDMQDMEFTVEHGKLYMLQTRNGKRTAQAALKVAVDLVDEGRAHRVFRAAAVFQPRGVVVILQQLYLIREAKSCAHLDLVFRLVVPVAAGGLALTAEHRGQAVLARSLGHIVSDTVLVAPALLPRLAGGRVFLLLIGEVEGQARVDDGLTAQHIFIVAAGHIDVRKDRVVGLPVDDAAGAAALVGFLLQAAYVLALLEVEVVVEAVAVDVGGHPRRGVLGGTEAQTVQTEAEFIVVLALAVLAACVHLTEQQLPVVALFTLVPVHGHTAAKVLHDDAAILAAGDVDGVAVAVAGLVDGVGDDLKNGVGAALHAVRTKDDGRALAHTVGTLQRSDAFVAIFLFSCHAAPPGPGMFLQWSRLKRFCYI